jgi:hypothetical protein
MAKKAGGAADELLARLGAPGTSRNVFTGMIKRADDDADSILFARAGDCSKWIKLPADHIADIKLVQMVSCEGHTHPLVHVFMKEPSSPEGETFAALAQLHQAPPRAAFAAPGSTPCYWDWGLNRWVCPS